jgi:DNA invertase Pin-like site-specific DNA recombinase
MRVIVYARVSTTRQADHDLSIPDQLAHADRYCAERGHVIAARYIDAGASARDDNRPEFQRMLGDIKSGAIIGDLLLVHSFSRFFRDSFGFAFYGREFGKFGVRVVSATQDVGEDSSGLLIRNVLSAFDEYSSLETAKHVTRSMLENARRGYWNGAKAPFGYRTIIVERHGNKDKKKLAIEPSEAEIVRLAFQLYLHGDGKTGPLGIKATTSYLNARGFTNGGQPFRIQFVHLMLRRSTYIGVHYFNRRDSRTLKPKAKEDWVTVAAPRLVEDDVFHAVQAQLDARHPKLTPPRIVNSEILLTGIARCETCGAPMRTRTGKSGRYWYYACSRKADIGATACDGGAVPMDMLDDLVTDAVCERVLEPKRLRTMIGALIARNARHQDREREQLRALFAKQRDLSHQVRNLVDVMEQGGLDAMRPVQDRYAKRQDELDQLNRLIALKRRTLEAPVAAVSQQKAAAFSAAVRAKLRDADNPSFRRAYLRLMLDKVVVGKESVRISGSKGVLAHQLSAENPLAPSLVPTLMEEWRARRDSNS